MAETIKIAVLCATYNRKDVSLTGILGLRDALKKSDNINASFFILDDLSSDGTADALQAADPDFRIKTGTGTLFWGGGMAAAYASIENKEAYDAFLLFNDDVEIEPKGVDRAIELFREKFVQPSQQGAIVGMCTDRTLKNVTYAGYNRNKSSSPWSARKVGEIGTVTPSDSFNGNFVIVSGNIMRQLKGVDKTFPHTVGDLELGYRVSNAGGEIFISDTPVGICEFNTPLSQKLKDLSISARIDFLRNQPNKLSADIAFLRRHGQYPKWIPAWLVAVIRRAKIAIQTILNI